MGERKATTKTQSCHEAYPVLADGKSDKLEPGADAWPWPWGLGAFMGRDSGVATKGRRAVRGTRRVTPPTVREWLASDWEGP